MQIAEIGVEDVIYAVLHMLLKPRALLLFNESVNISLGMIYHGHLTLY